MLVSDIQPTFRYQEKYERITSENLEFPLTNWLLKITFFDASWIKSK